MSFYHRRFGYGDRARSRTLRSFDYLLKPIAYDRVQNSLERYLKYISLLRANDSVNQRHVDELFNFQAKTDQLDGLPKGIDELTLIKIQEIYHHEPQAAYTAELLGQAIGISKTTARRYLEYCVASGFWKPVFSMVGWAVPNDFIKSANSTQHAECIRHELQSVVKGSLRCSPYFQHSF